MRTYSTGPLRRALHRFSTLFFPPVCPICLKSLWRPEDGSLCAECSSSCRPITPPFCNRCGRPFEGDEGHECQDCLMEPPPYRYMRSAYVYDGPLRQAILAFKMMREISRAAPLAGLLLATQQLGIDWEGYDLVVPVPLHDNRLRWRGYNQCSLLLREVARYRRVAWTEGALVRIKDTTPQFMVLPKERRKNVVGAFACPNPSDVDNRSILLVDDITTTGSTIMECAKALREAGASAVDAAVLSRPMKNI